MLELVTLPNLAAIWFLESYPISAPLLMGAPAYRCDEVIDDPICLISIGVATYTT